VLGHPGTMAAVEFLAPFFIGRVAGEPPVNRGWSKSLPAQAVLAPDRDAIIVPLADALMKANVRNGRGAVQQAGNAVESHIVAMAARLNPHKYVCFKAPLDLRLGRLMRTTPTV
jgi:hypothetical protein